jgi:hypothetical protein
MAYVFHSGARARARGSRREMKVLRRRRRRRRRRSHAPRSPCQWPYLYL